MTKRQGLFLSVVILAALSFGGLSVSAANRGPLTRPTRFAEPSTTISGKRVSVSLATVTAASADSITVTTTEQGVTTVWQISRSPNRLGATRKRDKIPAGVTVGAVIAFSGTIQNSVSEIRIAQRNGAALSVIPNSVRISEKRENGDPVQQPTRHLSSVPSAALIPAQITAQIQATTTDDDESDRAQVLLSQSVGEATTTPATITELATDTASTTNQTNEESIPIGEATSTMELDSISN